MATPNQQPDLDVEDIVKGDVVGSGRWEILDGGTRGGMATVFRARDTRTDGEVALKVIARRYIGRFDREKRFQNEGRLAARLKGHRNIATPIETGVLADRSNRMYLAMELVRGPTLLDYISMNGPLPIEKACIAIRDIARALRDLHASDVVHRDVTTNNVILVETGLDTHSAKLIDFGLAADIGSEGQSNERLTRVGELPGTPHYMSPEQVWGEAAHPAFDVYALGIVFFEMLVGEPPWHEMDDVAVKARKCDLALPPPQVSEHRRDVPPQLAALITECLQPRFDDRLPSSGMFVVQLDDVRARLGFVDPRAGESTGIVGLARTIEQPKREPKIKKMVADAMAAKEARVRAEVQDAVTRPVAGPSSAAGDAPQALITGQTAPATEAMLAGVDARNGREPTRRATAAESGQAAPRISGHTAPESDAAVGRAAGQTEVASSAAPDRRWVAVLGIAAGLLVAVPLIWWLSGGAATEGETGEPVAVAGTLPDRSKSETAGAAMASPGASSGAAEADASSGGVADDAAQPEPAAEGVAESGGGDATPAADEGPRDDASAADGAADGAAVVAADDAADDADDAADDASGGDDGKAPAGDGGSTAVPTPDPPTKAPSKWTEERCAAERKQAMTDRLAGRFAGVLTHTRVKRCWPNERERLELRVRAFSELGRYDDCIDAGGRSTDAGVARMVRRCRKKLDSGA